MIEKLSYIVPVMNPFFMAIKRPLKWVPKMGSKGKMKQLENLFIESIRKTPQVDFNHLTGDLILSGRSIPENASEFYEPLYKWVSEYVNDPKQTTNLRFNLEYFNTASAIWLAKITKALTRMKNPENILIVHHYFNLEDFDSMDTEEIKDTLSNVVDEINTTAISIGVKIYGTGDNGEIIKESTVLI